MYAKQYPHYLLVLPPTRGSEQNEQGDWTTPQREDFPTLVSVCREETAGRGNEIRTAGGSYMKYSSIIYIPKSYTGSLPQEGAELIIADDPEGYSVRIRGVVLKRSHDQLHSRLWI